MTTDTIRAAFERYDREVWKRHSHPPSYVINAGDGLYTSHQVQKRFEVYRQGYLDSGEPDYPENDGTDFAHSAWWRGHDYSVLRLCQIINEILDGDGQDNGGVAVNTDWPLLKTRLHRLKSMMTNARVEK